MKCHSCHRNIPAGVAAEKMIIEYLQGDGSTKVFGYMMPAGRLSEATGRILRGYHHKCYWIRRKRENRGDPVSGRVVGSLPTGYDIAAMVVNRDDIEALGLTEDQLRERGTAALSARLDKLREVARRIGKGVGDPTVTEAFRAEERGGPYEHAHEFRLDDAYQLGAHLRYAHGYVAEPTAGAAPRWHRVHDELHAQAALAATTALRHADPGHVEATESDWRHHVVAEITELT